MFTIMMLLTGMLSSFSTQDSAPSHTSAALDPPAIQQAGYFLSDRAAAGAKVYPARSGFESLNGLTLRDRIEDAERLHGPASRQVPAYMGGEERRYGEANVGLYEGWIYYVSVPGDAGSFTLNGQKLPMDADRIRASLGTPDFEAEDGFGYAHDGQAIKIFVEASTGTVRSVDLFDDTPV
ncbi:hypothetical protein [Saccharibacillus brassicae]|uniref:DUF4309 domain-containing protein n=1 Tax=Saccharibacillus brassicae TaxID=2583377 RepID=A0A4Y6UW89_SACBS|nr:hypothetical protein [Saccharibacillus brassicae]QDH20631.1 hypothetical protein FFV09_07065 [Saccharibacillus brassicae]